MASPSAWKYKALHFKIPKVSGLRKNYVICRSNKRTISMCIFMGFLNCAAAIFLLRLDKKEAERKKRWENKQKDWGNSRHKVVRYRHPNWKQKLSINLFTMRNARNAFPILCPSSNLLQHHFGTVLSFFVLKKETGDVDFCLGFKITEA